MEVFIPALLGCLLGLVVGCALVYAVFMIRFK
jgi:hypothetical protein